MLRVVFNLQQNQDRLNVYHARRVRCPAQETPDGDFHKRETEPRDDVPLPTEHKDDDGVQRCDGPNRRSDKHKPELEHRKMRRTIGESFKYSRAAEEGRVCKVE